MLMPWQVRSATDRSEAVRALEAFEGLVLIGLQSTNGSVPAAVHQIEPQERLEIIHRLERNTDPRQDIWIATTSERAGPLMYSLVHALVVPTVEARVDLLLSRTEQNDPDAEAYDGFGEFALLTLALDHIGVPTLTVPLPVDVERTGLAPAGWLEHEPGVYVREATAGQTPS